MRKHNDTNRKRTGRKAREEQAQLMRWRQLRAAARRVGVKKMLRYIDTRSDPLAHVPVRHK